MLSGLILITGSKTRRFFEDTLVECELIGRQKSDGVLASHFVSGMYTHHQKTVICDAAFEEDESMRKIVAYVGGLDIAGGRYDSPEFPLFRTLKTLHEGDYLRLVCTYLHSGPLKYTRSRFYNVNRGSFTKDFRVLKIRS